MLANMKMSAEEAKEQYGQSAIADAPEYPYGLCINLDEEAIAKLGLSVLPQVGQKMMIHARVEVKSVSSYQSQGGDVEKTLSLQITDMEIGEDQVAKEASTALYEG